MKPLPFVKQYFAEKLPPFVRYLHYLVLSLVVTQILISEFMEVSSRGNIGRGAVEYTSTWAHIGIGLSLLVLSIVFIITELSRHGFSYFFPYLSGDTAQLKTDLQNLKTLNLPKLSPGGLAAIVQGLGLSALLLVTLSGAAWFLLWSAESSLAGLVKEFHELLTGLIEAYLIGHGSMGLLHILLAYRNTRKS